MGEFFSVLLYKILIPVVVVGILIYGVSYWRGRRSGSSRGFYHLVNRKVGGIFSGSER